MVMSKRRQAVTATLEKSKERFKDPHDEKALNVEKTHERERYELEIEPMLFQISILARDGATQEEIAEFLGMSRTTLVKYRAIYPKLDEAIEAGQEAITTAVESALEKLCNGYIYKEIKNIYVKKTQTDSEGKLTYEKVKYEESIKQKHPDLAAIIFYLTNVKGDVWKKQIDVNSISKNINANMFAGNANITQDMINKALKEFNLENFKTGQDFDVIETDANADDNEESDDELFEEESEEEFTE